ncbi:MAG: VOC family protein [Pseudomonadota bacterium]|nr:VOC family protein [Pseudomonadota bacterium]
MSLSVHHIALNAADPRGLAQLYQAAADFQQVEERANVRWVAAPNLFIALHPATRPIGPAETERRVCDPGITHFCVQSGAGQRLWDRWSNAGLDFNGPPVALGTGATYAYGRDPECNVIEAEGIAADPDTPAWIAHVALATPSLDSMTDFYARLIGRAPHHRGTYANPLFERITGLADVEVSAAWIMADNLIVELWQYHNPPTLAADPLADGAPGYRHLGFACTDLVAEVRRLQASGIALDEPREVSGLRSAQGRDPDGNLFVVTQIAAPSHALALSSLSAPHIITDRNRQLLATGD